MSLQGAHSAPTAGAYVIGIWVLIEILNWDSQLSALILRLLSSIAR